MTEETYILTLLRPDGISVDDMERRIAQHLEEMYDCMGEMPVTRDRNIRVMAVRPCVDEPSSKISSEPA